jgi:hypothetical protein
LGDDATLAIAQRALGSHLETRAVRIPLDKKTARSRETAPMLHPRRLATTRGVSRR